MRAKMLPSASSINKRGRQTIFLFHYLSQVAIGHRLNQTAGPGSLETEAPHISKDFLLDIG